MKDKRKEVIERVLAILADRGEEYGDSRECLARISNAWNVLGFRVIDGANDRCVHPLDVVAAMVALKLCRLASTNSKDTWEDIIGYGILGRELC